MCCTVFLVKILQTEHISGQTEKMRFPVMKSGGRYVACSVLLSIHVLACCVVFTTVLPSLKSNPLFLLWKGLNYLLHKVYLQEHSHPQRCLMRPQYLKSISHHRFSIVQVFDQEVAHASWWGLSSAICTTYAHRHGYGYIYVHATPSKGSSLLHYRNRTLHWARIPILLWLLNQQPDIDWWFYLDMDSMINPSAIEYPIPWIFSALQHPGCLIRHSQHAPINLIFFSNSPLEPHMPCSGSFLASSSSGSALALWWNHNSNPYFDNHSEFDQHIVHELMFFSPEEFQFAVLDVRQFDMSVPLSFIRHYSGSRASPNMFHHRILRSISRAPKAIRISSLDIMHAINRVRQRQTLKCFIDLASRRYSETVTGTDERISCQYVWKNVTTADLAL